MNVYLEKLERIEFIVTMCCTGKCRHCSEGDHSAYHGHIDGATAAEAVTEVCRHYSIKSLMTFGGEPLLFPETVCAIHSAAAKAGIPCREIITNGYFTKDKARIAEVAHLLAESGANRILLSVDAFHQETIPLEPVEFFAERARGEGIPIELSPAWLVGRNADNPYNSETRRLLEGFSEKGFGIADGNVIFPKGNALKYLGDYAENIAEISDPYEEDPRELHSLCFDADGSVLNGNIYDNDIMDIIRDYKP